MSHLTSERIVRRKFEPGEVLHNGLYTRANRVPQKRNAELSTGLTPQEQTKRSNKILTVMKSSIKCNLLTSRVKLCHLEYDGLMISCRVTQL